MTGLLQTIQHPTQQPHQHPGGGQGACSRQTCQHSGRVGSSSKVPVIRRSSCRGTYGVTNCDASVRICTVGPDQPTNRRTWWHKPVLRPWNWQLPAMDTAPTALLTCLPVPLTVLPAALAHGCLHPAAQQHQCLTPSGCCASAGLSVGPATSEQYGHNSSAAQNLNMFCVLVRLKVRGCK